ncbi:hypothetical protein BCR39DRAFT_522914 [Naematelia encephala]|uniref:Uncharacterized protein n=1 Tax=Naematelia encephala TaxID=71784 RepID=A0A1Y2BDF4_9TREE|nr:hypothetical protein BCR39DRAFT_522914 [Naematelia encephala]
MSGIAAATAPADGKSSSSKEPHKMRITSGGSIASYVKFALTFLDENPHRPLILHTIAPPPPPPPTTTTPTKGTKPSKRPTSTLTPSLLNTPRLISVVELIKRAYMQRIESPESRKGKERAIGIWQYTESGLLPFVNLEREKGLQVEGDTETETALERVLGGKTQPKMTHQPFLQITLSTSPLGWESRRGVTCQYVMVRRRRPRNKVPPADIMENEPGEVEKPLESLGVADVDLGTKINRDAPTAAMEKKRKSEGSQEGVVKKRPKGKQR